MSLKISDLVAAGVSASTDLFEIETAAGESKKLTAAQLLAYIQNNITPPTRIFAQFAGNGSTTSFDLPTTGSTEFGVMVFTTISGQLVLRDPDDYSVNIALDSDTSATATITASATTEGSTANIVDNNAATVFAAEYGSSGQWIKFDFGVGVTKTIIAARFYPLQAESANRVINGHNWEYSDNNVSWTSAASDTNNIKDTYTALKRWSSVGAHRYWRMYITSLRTINSGATPSYPRLAEIELFEASASGGISGITFSAAPATGTVLIEYAES